MKYQHNVLMQSREILIKQKYNASISEDGCLELTIANGAPRNTDQKKKGILLYIPEL